MKRCTRAQGVEVSSNKLGGLGVSPWIAIATAAGFPTTPIQVGGWMIRGRENLCYVRVDISRTPIEPPRSREVRNFAQNQQAAPVKLVDSTHAWEGRVETFRTKNAHQRNT